MYNRGQNRKESSFLGSSHFSLEFSRLKPLFTEHPLCVLCCETLEIQKLFMPFTFQELTKSFLISPVVFVFQYLCRGFPEASQLVMNLPERQETLFQFLG